MPNDLPETLPDLDDGVRLRAESPPVEPYAPPVVRPRARPKFQDKRWKHLLLFALTALTTTMVGVIYYVNYTTDLGARQAVISGMLLWRGLWFSVPVLLILGAHEMGHYLLCRRYSVDASLPYFIPFPFFPSGTLGAVIRIREAFPTRTVLFDIGVAGPIGGFLVLVPLLFWGMAMSRIVPTPHDGTGVSFQEPLLFQFASRLIVGHLGAGQSLNAHPMVFAAWFGMLATAINLLPFGQLDGGHITYATSKRASVPASILTVSATVIMAFVSKNWVALAIMMLAMMFVFGASHPRVLDEEEALGSGRRVLAWLALAMLILCFTPIPLQELKFG